MIGIISAIDIELETLIKKMQGVKKETYASMDYYIGTLEGVDVCVCMCGVGKVNAAMHTQILIDRFLPKAIIQSGVAGALKRGVKQLDLVVGTELVYHDMQDEVIKNFGPLEPVYYCDEKLLKEAIEISGEANVHVGRIATGDWFVSSNEDKERIYNKTHALCTEMEGCAVAHTAYLNKVPFVVIRSISDSADDSAERSFEEFGYIAADCLVDIVTNLVRRIE